MLFFWPGVAHYDTISQYQQVVSGRYYDWHPPIMARLWSLFYGMGWRGQVPMFVLQMSLFWLGMGLIGAALARIGRPAAAVATLALGLWPPLLGWQAVVVKDGQMAAALLAATGIVAWKRLADQRIGGPSAVAVLLLLAYAILVRANAIFAAAPLAAGLFTSWRWRDWPARFALIGAATIAVLMVSPAINHRLLGADASGVEAVQPIFDLAGIAHRVGPDAVPLLPPTTWRELEARGCASSILWDIFSIGKRCDFIQHGLAGRPSADIFSAWTRAILDHPQAYLAHRLAHWNATMRWFVPANFPQAVPQAQSLPNRYGLTSPDVRVRYFSAIAGPIATGPLGAPIVALGIALAVLALARPSQSPAHALAVPLALSAAAMESSFLVVSIASDWRYHLWSILAGGVAGILLLTERLPARRAYLALAVLMLVIGTSLIARLTLPEIGTRYEDLIER